MTILVTGATGNIGRLVVDHLLRAGATGVRALTHHPERAQLPAAVEVVPGYVGKPATLGDALVGVERMYLAPVPETAQEVVALAEQAGVQHIVDLAGEPGTAWADVATAVEGSGVAWTHLVPGEFMENATIWARQIRTAGAVRDAYAGAANAPICMDDIAAIATTALLGDEHAGKSYPLTGPETLTRADKVRLIGAALGREVPYVEVSHDEAVAELTPDMGEYAGWYLDGMAQLVQHPQAVSPTYAEVMGHPGTTFAQWAVQHVASFCEEGPVGLRP